MAQLPEENWSSVTWKGGRLEQLRRALSLTVRERLCLIKLPICCWR